MSFHPLILPNGASIACPSPTRNILERTKLQKLPSLPKREIFEHSKPIPEIPTHCANCGKTLKFEREFHQSVAVCEKCLAIYSAVDSILNQVSEQRAIQARKIKYLEKLNGGQK